MENLRNTSSASVNQHIEESNILQIDWNERWKQVNQSASWRNRGEEDWDERAKEFQRWVKTDDYIEQVLSRIKVDASSTVLDIGCGQGKLTIPLAKRVKSVIALDISKEMLKYVSENAAGEGLNNIKCVNKGWEDVVTGEDIEICDVAIASRSLVWFDLKEALSKINRVSRQRVYLTRVASPSPFDAGVYRAIGREYKPGPDYIYVYNLLYEMGIYADIKVFESGSRVCYPNPDKALDDWRWKIGKLKPGEEERLRTHLVERLEGGNGTFELRTESKWALICWEKSAGTERSIL